MLQIAILRTRISLAKVKHSEKALSPKIVLQTEATGRYRPSTSA